MLTMTGVTKRFGAITVLQDVSIHVGAAEVLALIGPNGAGKTMLLDIATGLIEPTEGEVLLDGKPIAGRGAGFVSRDGVMRTFQRARLFPDLSVADNVLMVMTRTRERLWRSLVGLHGADESADIARADAVLERLGLVDLRDRPAGELSGGQQRLLEIGRTLVADDVRVLLLDEPASSLKPNAVGLLASLIQEHRLRGRAVLLVEHHPELVRRVATRVVSLREGRVVDAA